MPPVEREIATPHGPGRLIVRRAASARTTLLLSHGAGNGVDTHDLMALATYLPRHGVTVMLFEQPWKVAGRKVATPPSTLDDGLLAVASSLRTRTPLILGGRSAGARSALRCGRRLGASGVLALAFPLHPPGRPEKSRVEELQGCRLPTLVVQGERDPMGRPEEFPAGTDLVVVPEGDHSLRVPKRTGLSADDLDRLLVDAVLGWLVRTLGTGSVDRF